MGGEVEVSVPIVQRYSACFLEVGAFFGENGSLDRTNLQTDPTVDAGIKVDPIKICPLFVFPLSLVDAGHRTGINTIRDPFANIGHDRVGHECDLRIP